MNIYNNTKIINSRNTLRRSSDLNLVEEYSNRDIQFFSIYNESGISIEYTTEDYNNIKLNKKLYNYSTDQIELDSNSKFISTINRLPKPVNENISQEVAFIRSIPDNVNSLLLKKKHLNYIQIKLARKLYNRYAYIKGNLRLPIIKFGSTHSKSNLEYIYRKEHKLDNEKSVIYTYKDPKRLNKTLYRELSITRNIVKEPLRKQRALIKKKKIKNHLRYYLIRNNSYRRIWRHMYNKILRRNKNKLSNYYKNLRETHKQTWELLIGNSQLYEYAINR